MSLGELSHRGTVYTPSSQETTIDLVKGFVWFGIVTAAYALTGVAGLQLASVGSSVTLIWPPTGIAVAALLRLGPSALPAIFVGATLINLATGSSLVSALCISCGNTLAPSLAAWLLRTRFAFRNELGRAQDVWALFFAGALVPMSLSAVVGAAVLCMDGRVPFTSYFDVWAVWWLGDALGVLFTAPALLTISKSSLLALFGKSSRTWFLVSATATLVLSIASFSLTGMAAEREGALVYLTLAFLIWSSLRWGTFGSSVLLFVATAAAAVGTAHGRGPFGLLERELGFMLLWSFVAVASLAGLLMTTLRLERDRTEARLRESERRLATVIENLPGLVYRCLNDRDWTMELVSEQARTITGHAASAILSGQPTYSEIIVPEDREQVWATVQRAVAAHEPFQMEYRIQTADGRQRFVFERGTPVWDAEGNLTALEGIVFDNTERRLIEQELLQAQKMDAVGRLAGGIAHDLNNVLVAIIGFAELIRDGTAAGDERRERAAHILEAADRAADMTRQLLMYSRKQRLSPQVFSLNDVARETMRLLERLIGEHIRVRVETQARGAVYADPTQMQQVIMNLVLNARDAMPEGGELCVRTEDFDLPAQASFALGRLPAGKYVMLTVSDTGQGMSPEVAAQIFEPFFTTKGIGEGTGLGLATVYGVVKQSGGEILVSSEEGKGSIFRVFLKYVDAPLPMLAEEPIMQREAAAVGALILLIEDEPMVRELARDVLESEGYRVICTADAAEALALPDAQLHALDLIVTDVVLPGMSGPDMVRKLNQRRPGLRVLFVSGYPRGELMSLDAAQYDYLEKPFRPPQLASRVRALLDRPDSKV